MTAFQTLAALHYVTLAHATPALQFPQVHVWELKAVLLWAVRETESGRTLLSVTPKSLKVPRNSKGRTNAKKCGSTSTLLNLKSVRVNFDPEVWS